MAYQEINQAVGNVDIYLLDQILKGRFNSPARVLDAGCGEGRNLSYFFQNGFEVWGVDQNPAALQMLRMVSKSLSRDFDPERFIESDVAELPFPPNSFDIVLSSAVLHFARDESHFAQMVKEMSRVLKPGGTMFIRVANTTGVENTITSTGHSWYQLSDGSEFFLVSPLLLEQTLKECSLRYLEPFKTVVVDGIRSMGVLLLEKQ